MPWGVAAAAVGAGASMYAADKQADAASSAASRSVQSTRTARQSANQAQDMLNAMFGFGPIGDQKVRYRKEFKNWYQKDLRKQGLSRDEIMKRRDEFVQGKIDELQNNPLQGFLMQRFGNEQFQKDPGYQFRMDEGAKGVERSAAARGGALGGAALKELERYRQGFASNEFNNAAARFGNEQNRLYNMLSGYQGQQQQVGLGGLNAYNQYKMQGAEAGAASQLGMGNAMLQGAGMYQQNQAFNKQLDAYNQRTAAMGGGNYGGGSLNYGSAYRGLND